MNDDIFEEKDTVLYKIKSLDKLILRGFSSNMGKLKGKHGLENAPSRSQMEIIHYMLEHIDEDIYQKDLEKVLNLRRATISGILGTMEKNGFIERQIDKSDTRTKKIKLSLKAKEGYTEFRGNLKTLNETIIKGISKNDLEIFNKVLNQMENNLENKNMKGELYD